MVEAVPEHYVFAQAPTFFDMREEFSSEGSIRVVTRHYIGDEDEKVGEIRAIAEQDEEDEKCEPVAIIIDSGADAPIFPSTWRRSGRRVEVMMEEESYRMLRATRSLHKGNVKLKLL